jgi:uncharacterized C2H2 Zn-finger protein
MLRLFLAALTDRLGLTHSNCPYCGQIGRARWPWQGATRHVLTVHPIR